MFVFILMFSLGLIFLLPFGKEVRNLFKTGLIILSIYLAGWVVFLTWFAALWCWVDPACKALN